LPAGAILCNHCGFNRQTGTTLQRLLEVMTVRSWLKTASSMIRFLWRQQAGRIRKNSCISA
jgi:hypothetical protein